MRLSKLSRVCNSDYVSVMRVCIPAENKAKTARLLAEAKAQAEEVAAKVLEAEAAAAAAAEKAAAEKAVADEMDARERIMVEGRNEHEAWVKENRAKMEKEALAAARKAAEAAAKRAALEKQARVDTDDAVSQVVQSQNPGAYMCTYSCRLAG